MADRTISSFINAINKLAKQVERNNQITRNNTAEVRKLTKVLESRFPQGATEQDDAKHKEPIDEWTPEVLGERDRPID